MRSLTVGAIVLLMCTAYWLNAPSAQTIATNFDANGNAVAAQLR